MAVDSVDDVNQHAPVPGYVDPDGLDDADSAPPAVRRSEVSLATTIETYQRIQEQKRQRTIMAALALKGPRCPKCRIVLVRSRSHGFEYFLKLLTSRRPHRCRRCRWRGWEHPAPLDEGTLQEAERLLAELGDQAADR